MGSRRGRPTVAVELSGTERETLQRWARRPKSSQALGLRCRIVLAAAEGRHNNEIAAALGCHPATVSKWRRRFAERRLDGLDDDPRPGPPRSITDEVVEDVLVRTPRDVACGRDALVDAVDGRGGGGVPDGGVEDLAGVRAQAAPRRVLQGVA